MEEKTSWTKRWPRRWALNASVSLLVCFTFLLFGPLQLYLTNISDLWFTITDILPMLLLSFTIVFLCLIGVLSVVNEKFHSILCALVFGLGIALYIQGNFLAIRYGVLDGTTIAWEEYTLYGIVDTLAWVLCFIIPLGLLRWKRELFLTAAKLISICIVCVQLITLATLLFTTDLRKEDQILTTDHLFDMSTEKNIVLLILDEFDASYFNTIIAQDPTISEAFDGFTYFPNTVGMFLKTMPSIPYILTGRPYDNSVPYKEYLTYAYDSVPLFEELKEQEYCIDLYTGSSFISSQFEENVKNLIHQKASISSPSGLMRLFYKFTAFCYMPHYLKQPFWFYSGDFENYKEIPNSNITAHKIGSSRDDMWFYSQLCNGALNTNSPQKTFKLIHLYGAHAPFQINENLEIISGADALDASKGAIKIAATYLENLKKKNIYDNTTIFIMADHGAINLHENPLLMVKRSGDRGTFQISDAPISYADIHPTLLSELGSKTAERGIFEYASGEQRFRDYYFYRHDWMNYPAIYLPDIYHYVFFDDVRLPNSKYRDDIIYKPAETQVIDRSYHLGDAISFLKQSGTGEKYFDFGLSYYEETHTWTVDHHVLARLNLTEPTDQNLLITFNLLTIAGDKQDIRIKLGNDYAYEFTIYPNTKKFSYVIPNEYIRDGQVWIDFEQPDAFDVDSRVLAMALTSIQIEETDLEEGIFGDTDSFYTLGEELSFLAENGNGAEFFTKGLGSYENTHTWFAEKEASMRLPLAEAVEVDLLASFDIAYILHDRQYIEISSAEQTLFSGELHTGDKKLEFKIPKECLQNGGRLLELHFSFPDAASLETDTRNLSIALQKALVVEKNTDSE